MWIANDKYPRGFSEATIKRRNATVKVRPDEITECTCTLSISSKPHYDPTIGYRAEVLVSCGSLLLSTDLMGARIECRSIYLSNVSKSATRHFKQRTVISHSSGLGSVAVSAIAIRHPIFNTVLASDCGRARSDTHRISRNCYLSRSSPSHPLLPPSDWKWLWPDYGASVAKMIVRR